MTQNISRRNLLKLFGLTGVASTVSGGAEAQNEASAGFRLTLLHTNDTHDHLSQPC